MANKNQVQVPSEQLLKLYVYLTLSYSVLGHQWMKHGPKGLV